MEIRYQLQHNNLELSLGAQSYFHRSLTESTFKSYAKAWRAFVDYGRALTVHDAVEEIIGICVQTSVKKPQAKVDKFTGAVALVAAAGNFPSPCDNKVVQKIKKAAIRLHTEESRPKQLLMEVDKLLAYLSKDQAMAPNVKAVAATAAVVPSRPAELTNLQAQDVEFIFEDKELGVARKVMQAHMAIPDVDINKKFLVRIFVRNSKTDKQKKKGIEKMMQHPGDAWSPAWQMLDWARRAAKTPTQRFFGINSVATLRFVLKEVSRQATGVEVTPRNWRPAAATWLLRCGVDIESVAALGGWATTEALRRHYVRASTMDLATARRVAGHSMEAPNVQKEKQQVDKQKLTLGRPIFPQQPLRPAKGGTGVPGGKGGEDV